MSESGYTNEINRHGRSLLTVLSQLRRDSSVGRKVRDNTGVLRHRARYHSGVSRHRARDHTGVSSHRTRDRNGNRSVSKLSKIKRQ